MIASTYTCTCEVSFQNTNQFSKNTSQNWTFLSCAPVLDEGGILMLNFQKQIQKYFFESLYTARQYFQNIIGANNSSKLPESSPVRCPSRYRVQTFDQNYRQTG